MQVVSRQRLWMQAATSLKSRCCKATSLHDLHSCTAHCTHEIHKFSVLKQFSIFRAGPQCAAGFRTPLQGGTCAHSSKSRPTRRGQDPCQNTSCLGSAKLCLAWEPLAEPMILWQRQAVDDRTDTETHRLSRDAQISLIPACAGCSLDQRQDGLPLQGATSLNGPPWTTLTLPTPQPGAWPAVARA